MKNNNRKFFKDKWNIYESLSAHEVQELCVAEITFTNLTGFLYLRKANVVNSNMKVLRQQLLDSMKESLFLAQN